MLDFTRCRLTPFQHQREDTQALIDHPYFFISSEMRTGKTKIVIDAAQFMFVDGIIDRVLVVAPAPVRDVWYDKDLGELKKHLWKDLPAVVQEFHSHPRAWQSGPDTHGLWWIITNFEFLRSENRLDEILPFCYKKTLLVLDESSFVRNYAAQQTKACMQLRKHCGRVVLLNGTPIFHSPLDLFSQGNLLSESILNCKYITHFRSRYAIMTPVLRHSGAALLDPRGKPINTISGWTEEGLVDLQRRFAPYTVRRLQKDCLDLPPKLDPVTLTVPLTATTTWKSYKAMRDNLVVWLSDNTVASASQAAIKSLRLAQITSGFLGGIEDAGVDYEPVDPGLLDSLDFEAYDGCLRETDRVDTGDGINRASDVDSPSTVRQPGLLPDTESAQRSYDVSRTEGPGNESTIRAIGREKLDVLLWFLGEQLEANPHFKVVVWCKFRPELFRMIDEVKTKFPQFEAAIIHGGQKKSDRLRALRLLKPETSPTDRPVFVGGTFGTGSFGLDFCAAHTSITMSPDYSPGKFAQASDRVYGPGQTEPIAYYNIIATGPKGQKTIDHAILAARQNGENIAAWTSAAWVKALTEE